MLWLRDDGSLFDLCVSTSSGTMLAFGNNVIARVAHDQFLFLRFVAGNVGMNTPSYKRSPLIGNTAIVRKRRVKGAFHGTCFDT